MFLKSLEIFGFKSFADRTRIEFADGITALLGPNGCGKSNVVDAIKWVIGEQGAKALRAEKMENVIFAGTEKRKPLNVAEVTLTISNESKLLDLDFAEVAIKRRLYRSGESEYFINGQPAKLKDIRELFWDTGVGKAAYSVMEQGKIDQILSSRPDERRYLFEEAAGITRFKARRAAAERDLERTENYMKQSEIVLEEVRREYDSLKKQAEETDKFRKLKTEEFETELDISLLRLKNLVRDKNLRAEGLEASRKRRDGLKEEICGIEAFLEENMSRVNTMQERMNSLMIEIADLQASKNGKMELSRHLAGRKSELKLKLSQLEAREAGLSERVADLQEDAAEQDALVRSFSRQLEETEINIASFEDSVNAALSRIAASEEESLRLESEIAAIESEQAERAPDIQSLAEEIAAQLDLRLKESGYSAARHLRAEEELASVAGRIKTLVEGKASIFAALEQSPLPQDLPRLSSIAVKAFSELESLVSQLDTAIESLKEAYPDFLDEFLSPEGIIAKKRIVDAEILQARNLCAEKRALIAELKEEARDLSKKAEGYRSTLEDLRLSRVQMEAQSRAAEEQARLIRREIASQEAQLKFLENEIYSSKKNLEEIAAQIEDVEAELAEIERNGACLAEEIAGLNSEIEASSSNVSGKQASLRELSEALSKEQSLMEKLHTDVSVSENEIRNVRENFRERYSRDLDEFTERMEALNAEPSELRERLNAAREGLKRLGSVNLQAPDQFEDAQERFLFLSGQLEDLRKAKEDLVIITEEIRAEASELFIDSYNKIKRNFHNMFRRLFGGGRAELKLINPENVLESGIEIFAQPPGKKLENISLLSGGEKSMTAVALLFATYMVKPSPFCLLDEIDAALDDQNVSRFVSMLREFANVSQYIVITHNKKTMMGAGTMLGITMEESGVTQLVAIRLENDIDYSIESDLAEEDSFEEENVPPEDGVVLPPHVIQRGAKTL